MTSQATPPALREVLLAVPEVSSDQWQIMSSASRWLVAVRASVLPLTLFSVIFAVLVAQPVGIWHWLQSGLCLLALLFAHATNNLINDYVDFHKGIDKNNYFRTQYGTHVLAAGLLTPKQFRQYIAATGAAAAFFAVLVMWLSSPLSYGFAACGAILVLFYTYPMKHWALGEIAVFLAWGPLMVAGVFAVLHGFVPSLVWWAGVVYGLGPTVVIFAKHIDKISADQAKQVHTLPVLLGSKWARITAQCLVLLQFLFSIGLAWHYHFYGLLVLVFALPSALGLLRVLKSPAPDGPPADYPKAAWPLWYTTHAFIFARNAGFWLSVGALCAFIFG